MSNADNGYVHILLHTSSTTDSNKLWRLAKNNQNDMTTNFTVTYSTKNVKVTGNGLGSQSQNGTWFYIIF